MSLTAEGVTYEFDYNGEPAGDVNRFDENGTVTMVEGHKNIDLKKFYTKNGTGDVLVLTMGTSGKTITTSESVKYVFRIFTDSQNKTGYNITYQNGTITLVKFNNGSEILTEDITSLGGVDKEKNEELLQVNFPKDKYLPQDSLEYLGVDGFSWLEAGNVTYVDYIHDLPGNPGIIAPDVIDDADGPGSDDREKEGSSSGLIAIVIIVIIIIAVVLVLLLRKKR
jgi:hypothetical protein